MNLLPLCPNCHLTDQHDPTSPIDQRKLALFRKYKDPTILTPQFEPLFRRMLFLLELDFGLFNVKGTLTEVAELASFIKGLKMGDHYSDSVVKLLHKPAHSRALRTDTPKYVFDQWHREERDEYFNIINKNREQVISLVIELLRYQDWPISLSTN